MKKTIFPLVMALCFSFLSLQEIVFAQEDPNTADFEGVIPRAKKGEKTCGWAYPKIEVEADGTNNFIFADSSKKYNVNVDAEENEAVQETQQRLKKLSIGAKISGGCVGLSDIPIIIIKLIDLVTKLAGTVAVIFGLYAGYQLITSELTQDREAAKNTIKYVAIGLAVCLLAWVIVNVIQVQLTA